MIIVEADLALTVRVRCEEHGPILTEAAVAATAIDSAFRHHRTYHRGLPCDIVVEAMAADRYHWQREDGQR